MGDLNFAHLHVHTEFSMLDGKGKIGTKDGKVGYVERTKQRGMSHLAITDHGNISGTYEFYKECREQDVEPILGCEFYFVPNAQQVKDDKEAERFHVVFLARGERGFEILTEISTATHNRFYYKPLLDRDVIDGLSKKDRKSLVVLSGCAGSIISRKVLNAVEGSARDELRWWKSKFPNFYIELQQHGTDFDRTLNRGLLKLARKEELPWVITNDPHYVTKDECAHHDALLAIQTASDLDDPNRFRFDGGGYHLRSPREIQRAFKSYGKEVWAPGCAETMRIAKACQTRIPAWESRTWHIPKFPGVDDADGELRRLARRGLRDRGLAKSSVHVERMNDELERFKNVPGMADFLLITWDAINEARNRGIRVGPGRGSVCGTFVGYLIGLHKVDSVKYKLLFERFLNPERPKMPDIDSDFPSSSRNEMIEYMVEKYGIENTMRVGAFQTMQDKGTFRALAKAFGISFQETNKLAKKIMEDAEGNCVLPPEIEKGYPELHTVLEALSGLKKGISRHPAGVLVMAPDDPVRALLPEMFIASSKQFVCQYDLDTVAGIGLLKQDFLALRTLDTIDETVRLVKMRHGVDLDPDSWVPDEGPDDKGVYRMLREGHTSGVFQMEGGTNHRGIQAIKCNRFEDIVSCTSLYRKGPLDAGADKRFLANKKERKVRVAHKSLKQFLDASWGEMIYQEQMFEILRSLAGFSWARVDDVKTAMTKKDPEKMAALKDEAVGGFQKVGKMNEAKAEKVWSMIEAQAGYLFNRSHAVAYSLLTYQTARLKHEYPLEYIAALLRTVDPKSKEAKEKRTTYITEAIRLGFKIAPPDINVSDEKFTPKGKRTLTFGLLDIKNVGESAVNRIMVYRNKKSERLDRRGLDPAKVFHSVAEVQIRANKSVLQALSESGALRSLGVEPESEKQEELLGWQFIDRLGNIRKKWAKRVVLPDGNNQCLLVGEIVSTEKKATKKGDPFYSWLIRWQPGEQFRITVFDSASELFELQKGSVVAVEGKWNETFNNLAIGDSIHARILKKVVAEPKKEVRTKHARGKRQDEVRF